MPYFPSFQLLFLALVCGLCLLTTLRLYNAVRADEAKAAAASWQTGAAADAGQAERPAEEGGLESAAPPPEPAALEDPAEGSCPAEDRTPLFQPGDMDRMFERLVGGGDLGGDFVASALSRDPWVVQFDNFLSQQECLEIVDEVGDERYHISQMWSGDPKNQVLWRNNSSFLCQDADRGYDHCNQFPSLVRLRERMASVLQVSLDHGDGMALFRYLPGGYYTRHHDYIPESINPSTFRNCGPRVLTFMAYVTEAGEGDGGETHFFELGLKVRPKRGRAILWADTFSDSPLEKDTRTAHEALVVHSGKKISATQWFHLYQYKDNRQRLCCD